jgi:hypothetical protein
MHTTPLLARSRALTRAIRLAFAAGALVASGTALGQATVGGVAGTVPSVTADTTVVIESTDTGLTRSVKPDASGRFLIGSLPSGRYKVTLKQPGKSDESQSVVVAAGTNAAVRFGGEVAMLEEVQVSALRRTVGLLDTSTAETSTVFSQSDIAELPVARNLTSVALLAPGTGMGDAEFGNFAYFAGSSVAENSYYINGFNVTNFRNGLGGASIPFEAYQDFQVKTGGYSAEFGRSTGGVINSTSKRGTNEWKFGVTMYATPQWGREQLPDTYVNTGALYGYRSNDESGSSDISVSAGGPVWKDHLFVYGIYQWRNSETDNYSTTTGYFSKNDDPFWLAKVDFNLTDNHVFEFTSFSDKATTTYDNFEYDPSVGMGSSIGQSWDYRGGRNNIFKYTGVLTDTFTVSALYGKGEYDLTSVSEQDACPWAYDSRPSYPANNQVYYIGCWASDSVVQGKDEREAYRIDIEWRLGDHRLRFGWDKEDNTSIDQTSYSGGVYYRYYKRDPGFTLPNGAKVPSTPGSATTDVVRARIYDVGGSFGVKSDAYYLEDNWQVSQDMLVTLGIRNETFENLNAQGAPFIKVTDQWSPRLGMSWDVKSDGTSKLFASAGRYYLPVASNTNVRLAGGEFFTENFYTFASINPSTAVPSGLSQLGTTTIYSDGEVPDPLTVVDQDITPQYQDELILGFEQRLNDQWIGGVRTIYRELKSAIEDVIVNEMLLKKYGYEDGTAHYILTNPGKDLTFAWDIDDDGDLDPVSFSGAETGYPEANRKYIAAEFYFEREMSDNWYLRGSYTWSHNYGNSEGYVRSDNGQDDAGITTQFDYPALTKGADGNLPNDRRHQFKVFGMYKVTPTVGVSANAFVQSGRPKNCFGYAPIDPSLPDGAGYQASTYGAEAFYCNDKLVPRGSVGTMPWTYSIDFGAEWRPEMFDEALALKLDIFNVFNSQKETAVIEQGESGGPGAPAAEYGIGRSFQSPRAIRFGVTYNFTL